VSSLPKLPSVFPISVASRELEKIPIPRTGQSCIGALYDWPIKLFFLRLLPATYTVLYFANLIVSEHMGWVRNVVLMNVYFGSGKPQGVGISGGEGPDGQMGEMQGSVYEQPKEEVDGSCHSKEGSK
jgi:hypothetical protein